MQMYYRNPQNREEAGKRFREASEAYQTLSDAKKRAQYDASLSGPAYRQASGHSEYSDPFASRPRGDRGTQCLHTPPNSTASMFVVT